MAKNNNLTDFLTDVANAIRNKTGTSGAINPQDFSARIASIQTGGGGGDTPTPSPTPTPDMPVIGDGKTYLYIKIAAEGRMTVPLYFTQTVANGVTIDWGDGSATQTLSGTGKVSTAHTYAEIGEYVISLDPADGCTLGLGGRKIYGEGVLGSGPTYDHVYQNMLKAVEIGNRETNIREGSFYGCHSLSSVVIPNSVTSIGSSAFQDCYSLSRMVIPNSVTSIGDNAFSSCYSLASVVIPQGVTSIEKGTFYDCSSLASVVIPDSVTSIGDRAFYRCYSLASIVIPKGVTNVGSSAFNSSGGIKYYDFSQCLAVPSLANINAFSSAPSDCKIIVPDALYDEWIAATNWSTYASYIIKKSDWDASQS